MEESQRNVGDQLAKRRARAAHRSAQERGHKASRRTRGRGMHRGGKEERKNKTAAFGSWAVQVRCRSADQRPYDHSAEGIPDI